MKNLKRLTRNGLTTMQFIDKASNWASDLDVVVSEGGKFWSRKYKGICFDTEEELKEYCFVSWCNQNNIIDYVKSAIERDEI